MKRVVILVVLLVAGFFLQQQLAVRHPTGKIPGPGAEGGVSGNFALYLVRTLGLRDLVAGVLWLGASGLFSFYVANFGSYNATYGSLGAVVVLLLWLYLSAAAVILGACINAETERQTGRDSTVGEPRPRGERGAEVADQLPETSEPATSGSDH
jgi:hypothetical protein